jgi:hypothetical protein
MDERTHTAVEQIAETANQLRELAVQADMPFMAHLLRLVMLEALKSSPLPTVLKLVPRVQ